MSGSEETVAAAATAATVGQRLRTERERQGLSVAKAADGIHMDTWAIDALETGDYSRLGPAVYAKGHLKRYADLLRLPSADILAAFDPHSADASPTDQPGISMRMPAAESIGRALPWMPIAAGALVLLIVVGVVWWRPWHSRAAANVAAAPAAGVVPAASAPVVEAPAAPPNTATVPAITPAIVASTPPHAVAPLPAASPASPPDSDPSAGLGRARLRLTCSADSWVDVHDAAGRRVYAGNCRAHSVRTVSGSAPLRIHLGAAGGVQMDVNNRPVSIPAQFVVRNAADFAAGADGVLRPLPAARPHG